MSDEKIRSRPHHCWPGGRLHALTSSWDDGSALDRRLAGILDAHGLRGTFCLNSGWCADHGDKRIGPEELSRVFANHEIAVHGPNHPCATRVPQSAWLADMIEDRTRLEAWTGRIIRGGSWPFGSFGPIATDTLAPAGLSYFRGLDQHIDGGTEYWLLPEREQWFNWRPSCFYREVLDKPERYESFRRYPCFSTLFFIWGHSWDLERDKTWDAFEAWCAKVGKDAGVWHATNIEIYDYLAAWRGLRWTADLRRVYNPSDISVWVQQDGASVEIPAARQVSL